MLPLSIFMIYCYVKLQLLHCGFPNLDSSSAFKFRFFNSFSNVEFLFYFFFLNVFYRLKEIFHSLNYSFLWKIYFGDGMWGEKLVFACCSSLNFAPRNSFENKKKKKKWKITLRIAKEWRFDIVSESSMDYAVAIPTVTALRSHQGNFLFPNFIFRLAFNQ